MPLCVQELDRRGIQLPVMIGGAAINRRFGRRAMFVEGERAYESGVFYCKDAFEGLDTMDQLQDSARRGAMVEQLMADARADIYLQTNVGKDIRAGNDAGARSAVAADVSIPKAPYFGTRVLRDIPLEEVLELLDLDELFRLQWGGRGSGPQWETAVRDVFRPTLARLTEEVLRERWLTPQAVYGVYPAQSQGNNVIVYDPAAYQSDGGSLRELARFHFPRQEGRDRLCIADYFRSVESGEVDVVAFQIVTVGNEATQRFERLQAAGEYAEALYSHGLGVELAEATAEWMHRRVFRDLGVAPGRGKRYSWGYGACPDLEDHGTLFRLLPATEALGMSHTSAFQLMPEQSTAAILVHHPEARYYAVRGAGQDAGGQAPALAAV
jgi:5-methyltetrahydrofolate--homocysteine methyltransferase